MKTLVPGIGLFALSFLFAIGATTESTKETKRAEVKVTVTGCVARPGVQRLWDFATLSEAIARAGSLTRFADKRAITVTSKSGEVKTYDYNDIARQDAPRKNPPLHDGDVIFVPDCYSADQPSH